MVLVAPCLSLLGAVLVPPPALADDSGRSGHGLGRGVFTGATVVDVVVGHRGPGQ